MTAGRLWLYVRIGVLVLLALFAIQLFVANINREGPARLLPWSTQADGVWPLVVAFVLGLVFVPLARATIAAGKELKADQRERRTEEVERAVRQKLNHSAAADEKTERES